MLDPLIPAVVLAGLGLAVGYLHGRRAGVAATEHKAARELGDYVAREAEKAHQLGYDRGWADAARLAASVEEVSRGPRA